MSRPISILLACAFLLLGIAVTPGASATASTVIASAGPLQNIWIGDELGCQVEHVNDAAYQFYPSATVPGDCGTLLVTGGALYAPDFVGHGATATGGLGAYTAFTPVSQTAVTGLGTAGSPYTLTTTVTVGATGLTLRETDTYVVGDDFYETTVVIQNGPAAERSGILYRAGDCFLGGSDSGYGALAITAPGSVACTKNANNSPAGRFEEFIPVTGGSRYYHDDFSDVWTWIGGHTAFPNTCDCTTLQDNGAGLSWDFSVAAGGSATFVNRLRFDVPEQEPQAQPGARCEATGLRVREADTLVPGAAALDFAHSTAWASVTPGAMPPAAPAPSPPPVPDAHSDAEEVGAHYASGLVTVDASGVFSRCDVAAHDPGTGPQTHAYGRGGVADLTLRVAGNTVHLELMDFELDARGTPPVTNAWQACDLIEASTTPTGKVVGLCSPNAAVIACGGLIAAVCNLVFGTVNCIVQVQYDWTAGPVLNAFGQWEYEGSFVRLHLESACTGTVAVDIDVGYVRVSASGGPAPPFVNYVPNVGCTLAAALCT